MMNKYHPFHMVTLSPWPIMASMVVWAATSSSAMLMGNKNVSSKMQVISAVLATISSMWWADTIKESKSEGEHQNKVSKGLKMGMVMFITSEVMFFTSFFWSYFHSGVSPSLEVGQSWPPTGVNSFDPTNVPLLNTLVLISSGVTVTWAHHTILKNMYKKSIVGMAITCVLGAYFSFLQYMEYKQGEFSMSDSSYGTIFFMATGFHGIHVIVGTTFLMVSAMNMMKKSISKGHHNSFEMAAWYWHFVDVVWLFLYLSVYWWGK